jgi:hypothetical protein
MRVIIRDERASVYAGVRSADWFAALRPFGLDPENRERDLGASIHRLRGLLVRLVRAGRPATCGVMGCLVRAGRATTSEEVAEAVNHGECDIFIALAVRLLEDSLQDHGVVIHAQDLPAPSGRRTGHTWVRWNGLHYDAETFGVDQPWMLKFFQEELPHYPSEVRKRLLEMLEGVAA